MENSYFYYHFQSLSHVRLSRHADPFTKKNKFSMLTVNTSRISMRKFWNEACAVAAISNE